MGSVVHKLLEVPSLKTNDLDTFALKKGSAAFRLEESVLPELSDAKNERFFLSTIVLNLSTIVLYLHWGICSAVSTSAQLLVKVQTPISISNPKHTD